MELREYLKILLKRWWIILPLTFVSLTTALVFSYMQTPIYEANSTYVTKLDSTDTQGQPDTIIYGMDTLANRQRIFVTYCEVMTSQAVRQQAEGLLGIDPAVVDMQNYKVFCSNLPETNVLRLTVQGPAPELTNRLNHAIGIAGIARANNLYNYFPLETLDDTRLEESPVSPKYLQNTILGGALGLIIGIMLALMIEYLRHPLERLEALSIRNPQLGIYNERYFRQRFEEENSRAHARLRPISLALVRLIPSEDFALLPEAVQTTLLRSAALKMQDSVRHSDLLAYLGPQTFGILLAETPGDEAQDVLKKLHMDLRGSTFEAGGYVSGFVANTGVIASSGGALGYPAMLAKVNEALAIADERGENSIHLLRATPRPFVSAEDALTESEPASSGMPFDSESLSPFGEQDVDQTDWTVDLADELAATTPDSRPGAEQPATKSMLTKALRQRRASAPLQDDEPETNA